MTEDTDLDDDLDNLDEIDDDMSLADVQTVVEATEVPATDVVETIKIRSYSLEQEKRIIHELYSKVYKGLTGELDEEGNIPEFPLDGPNPWGLFELQVMSMILKKPREQCRDDLLDIKRHCIRAGTNFIQAVQTKSINKYLAEMKQRKEARAALLASGSLKTKARVDFPYTYVECEYEEETP